jgi:hypothetical protein
MAMMKIRIMRVRMHNFLMPMEVRVRFARRVSRTMRMLMMFIMPVQVFVDQWFVLVQMGMAFGEM